MRPSAVTVIAVIHEAWCVVIEDEACKPAVAQRAHDPQRSEIALAEKTLFKHRYRAFHIAKVHVADLPARAK